MITIDFGAIQIGTLVSAIIIGGSGLLVFWQQKRRRANALRSALITELKSMQNVIETLGENADDLRGIDNDVFQGMLHSTVYERSADDLGLLQEYEIRALVHFYASIPVTGETIEVHKEYEGFDSLDEDLFLGLDSLREATIAALEHSPRFYERWMEDWTNPSDDIQGFMEDVVEYTDDSSIQPPKDNQSDG